MAWLLLLEFNKTVVGNKPREFFSQMLAYIIKIKVFEIAELSGMKQNQDGDYLAVRQSK